MIPNPDQSIKQIQKEDRQWGIWGSELCGSVRGL